MKRSLVEGIDGEAAEEFGVEVGGFLGHDFAGERDIAELIEGDGLDEESDVGVAGIDHGDRLLGVADVADVAEAGDGVGIEAEDVIENDGVELGDAELTLLGGQAFHERRRWRRAWG